MFKFRKKRPKVKPRTNVQCVSCAKIEERLCSIEKSIQLIHENISKNELNRLNVEYITENKKREREKESIIETNRIFEDIRSCLVNIMNKDKTRNFFSINF